MEVLHEAWSANDLPFSCARPRSLYYFLSLNHLLFLIFLTHAVGRHAARCDTFYFLCAGHKGKLNAMLDGRLFLFFFSFWLVWRTMWQYNCIIWLHYCKGCVAAKCHRRRRRSGDALTCCIVCFMPVPENTICQFVLQTICFRQTGNHEICYGKELNVPCGNTGAPPHPRNVLSTKISTKDCETREHRAFDSIWSAL